MASPSHNSSFLLALLLLLLPLLLATSANAAEEKLTHLHFYFHDVVSGKNATAVHVAGPPPGNSTSPAAAFGLITMMDDLLTEGPEPTSRPVGRAQGMYACAALQELGFLQAMNLVFDGRDVLTVLGRNAPMHAEREMPVVGGSGAYRFARGYALARTYSLDMSTGDAVVEYDVYVRHY